MSIEIGSITFSTVAKILLMVLNKRPWCHFKCLAEQKEWRGFILIWWHRFHVWKHRHLLAWHVRATLLTDLGSYMWMAFLNDRCGKNYFEKQMRGKICFLKIPRKKYKSWLPTESNNVTWVWKQSCGNMQSQSGQSHRLTWTSSNRLNSTTWNIFGLLWETIQQTNQATSVLCK